MTLILGIDPGLANCGWGIIDVHGSKITFVDSGTITTKPSKLILDRIVQIHQSLTKVMLQYQPEEAAVEEIFVNKNPLSSIKLAQARGAIMLSLAIANLPLTEYAATLVKKSLVGVGRADKNQVATMVKYLLPKSKADSEHAADALAVALCHSSLRNCNDW